MIKYLKAGSTTDSGAREMVRKVIIEILLVPESLNTSSEEIEDDILKELQDGFLIIPWSAKLEEIRVLDA